MRWTYLRRPVKDPVDYLRTEFTVESEVLAQRVVDAARVGSTVYMAIECGDRSTGRRYTLAAIVLIADGRDGFGYKAALCSNGHRNQNGTGLDLERADYNLSGR